MSIWNSCHVYIFTKTLNFKSVLIVVCQITKKCECNDLAYLTSAPVLNQTMHDMIKAALELMYYWTADVQKQICEG